MLFARAVCVVAVATGSVACAPRAAEPPKPMVLPSASGTVVTAIDAGTPEAAPPPDAAPVEEPWPRAPWSILARGRDLDDVGVQRLGTVALLVAQKAATLRMWTVDGDSVTERSALSEGLPPFGAIDLAAEKKPSFPKDNPKTSVGFAEDGPGDGPHFAGQRELVAITGAWPGPLWLVADRWGGERYAWVASDAYRSSGAGWTHVGGTNALGARYSFVTTWADGGLLAIRQFDYQSMGKDAPRFVAFGTQRKPPQLPPSSWPCTGGMNVAQLQAFATGEVVMVGAACDPGGGVMILRWSGGAALPTILRLRGVQGLAASLSVQVPSADRIELVAEAAEPYVGAPAKDAKWSTKKLTVDFEKGAYVVKDARDAPAQEPDAEGRDEIALHAPKAIQLTTTGGAVVGSRRFVVATVGKGADAGTVVLWDGPKRAAVGM